MTVRTQGLQYRGRSLVSAPSREGHKRVAIRIAESRLRPRLSHFFDAKRNMPPKAKGDKKIEMEKEEDDEGGEAGIRATLQGG